MTVAAHRRGLPPWLLWFWPLLLLAAAWLWAPLRTRADYPGMPCTADAATFLERASYALFFLPALGLLLLLTAVVRRAVKRHRRGWALILVSAAAVISVVYLVFAGLSAQPQQEQSATCPNATPLDQPLHCWNRSSPFPVFEMNAYGERPQTAGALAQMSQGLAAQKKDVFLYEAFVLNTVDPAVVSYSNGRLFVLQRPDQSVFGDSCLGEAQAKALEFQQHRVGFYRFSTRESPPVDAFFLHDPATNGEVGYEVIDFRHGGEALAYVKPQDLRAVESEYLDRVTSSLATLNNDLDREGKTPSPPGALATMRQDFQRITADLANNVPPRLQTYQQSRLRRFLENYDLILAAEESAAQGQSGLKIHSGAYEQHRNFYYQEPRVTRLIGYLYLQEPGKTFSDDELSTVNWAVF